MEIMERTLICQGDEGEGRALGQKPSGLGSILGSTADGQGRSSAVAAPAAQRPTHPAARAPAVARSFPAVTHVMPFFYSVTFFFLEFFILERGNVSYMNGNQSRGP